MKADLTPLQENARAILARLDLEAIERPDAIFPARAMRDDLRAALIAEGVQPVDVVPRNTPGARLSRLLNPWTAEITYLCGHTKQVEPPNSRECQYTDNQMRLWMDHEASFVCLTCAYGTPTPRVGEVRA